MKRIKKTRLFSVTVICALALFFLLPAPCLPIPSGPSGENNQSVFVDLRELDGLSNDAKKEIINNKLEKLKKVKKGVNTAEEAVKGSLADITPDKAAAWSKVLTDTIRTVCTDLSIGVNEFVKSDVGKLTLVVIIYKVIGEDLLKIALFGIAWLIFTALLYVSFRHFHMSERITTKAESGRAVDVKYVPRFKWEKNSHGEYTSMGVSAFFHGLFFFLFVLTAFLFII